MSALPCPFCGGEEADTDTVVYADGKPHLYRVRCRGCGAFTRWRETEEAAWPDWNRRPAKPGQGEINMLISKNFFILRDLAYYRNPVTGTCTAQKEFLGKALRIQEEVFRAAYRECETLGGKGKARA